MKSQLEALAIITELCESEKIDYMLVGSFSSNFYGIPRATKDADIVLEVTPAQRNALIAKLPKEMSADPQMTFETATSTSKTLIYVNSICFEIELFDLSEDPFDQSRFSRRTVVNYLGKEIYLPTAEDVIIQKIRWFKNAVRAKDLEDAQSVYLVQKEYLDWEYMLRWAKEHGTEEQMDSLKIESDVK